MPLCRKDEVSPAQTPGSSGACALVDTAALVHNYRLIRGLAAPGTAVMAIVKDNAYGHGDALVSRTLEAAGCEMFGVAFADEGVRLRQAGITRPVIVLGGAAPGDIPAIFESGLTPVVYDMENARLLNGFAEGAGKRLAVHVKIDSGMGRLGVLPDHVEGFFSRFKDFKNLSLEGVLSHFCEAEAGDKGYSRQQLSTFLQALEKIRELGCSPCYTHMANSAAVACLPESHFNLVRPGIMLYGAYPAPAFAERASVALRPVMELKTRVLQVKRLPPGSPVSYGRTFVTKRESAIATLAIGYGDGLPRRLSANGGEALIKGRRAPLVGTICMDFTMADVTGIEGVRAGDEAVIIGSRGGARGPEAITAGDIAAKTGTIPYEILCNVSSRVPRLPS